MSNGSINLPVQGGGGGPPAVGDIQIWLSHRSGVGSAPNAVGVYDSVFKDTGSGGDYWTYVSDAVNGDSITIEKAGLYTVDVVETGGSDLQYMIWGITLNSSNLLAGPKDLPVGEAIAIVYSAFNGIEYTPYTCSSTQYLNVGDVLRWQYGNANATDAATTASLTSFKVTYIGDY